MRIYRPALAVAIAISLVIELPAAANRAAATEVSPDGAKAIRVFGGDYRDKSAHDAVPAEAHPDRAAGDAAGTPAPSGDPMLAVSVMDPVASENAMACRAATRGIFTDPSSWGSCAPLTPPPGAPATPAAPTLPTPAQIAALVWTHEIQLPAPTLAVQPGAAMVGRLAYLEIHGNPTLPWQGDVLGEHVTINATSTYDVNWGDTHTDTGLTTQGGPYPDGTITHAYQNAGHYTLTVTQNWTATFNIGAVTGTIDNVLHTQATLPLPAFEVQANRD